MKIKVKEWWRWVRKVDWELTEVTPTSYDGLIATQLHPYFWEVWMDKRTGEQRIVACT